MVLLVVDTQKAIVNNKLYNYDLFVSNVKQIIDTARKNNIEVIYGFTEPLACHSKQSTYYMVPDASDHHVNACCSSSLLEERQQEADDTGLKHSAASSAHCGIFMKYDTFIDKCFFRKSALFTHSD